MKLTPLLFTLLIVQAKASDPYRELSDAVSNFDHKTIIAHTKSHPDPFSIQAELHHLEKVLEKLKRCKKIVERDNCKPPYSEDAQDHIIQDQPLRNFTLLLCNRFKIPVPKRQLDNVQFYLVQQHINQLYKNCLNTEKLLNSLLHGLEICSDEEADTKTFTLADFMTCYNS